MDVIEKCIEDKTIIYAVIITEKTVDDFSTELQKNKLSGSKVVEKLINEWLKEQKKAE